MTTKLDIDILQAADLHIGGFRFAYEYLARTAACLDQLYNIVVARARKVKYLVFVITGDFWHGKGLYEDERIVGWEFLTKVLAIENVTVVMLNGNHDYYNHTGITMIHEFKEASRVIRNLNIVTNKPRTVELSFDNITLSIMCVPCQQHLSTTMMNGMLSTLRKTAKGKYVYAAIHECFQGSSNESGFKYPSKLELPQSDNVLGYMLGDIHMRQQIGDRAFYSGSPWQTRFDEPSPDRGVLLWHVGETNPEFIRVKNVPRLIETLRPEIAKKLANTEHTVRYIGLTPLNFQAPNVVSEDTTDNQTDGTVEACQSIDDVRAVTSADLIGGLDSYLKKHKLDEHDVHYGVELVEQAMKGLL